MTHLRGWAGYALLIAAAAALGVAGGRRSEVSSPIPSVHNTGAAGTAALYTWLRESGFDVRAHAAPLTQLPADVRTVVLAAPTARALEEEELAALDAFAAKGRTVVLMLPRDSRPGTGRLFSWVGARRGPTPRDALVDTERTTTDPSGATAQVWLRAGALAQAHTLRVENAPSVVLNDASALPAAGRRSAVVAWWVPRGAGGIWVFAGPDLAQNKRIELEDNAAFWHALASAGPLAFDEFHHAADDARPSSPGLPALTGQLLLCFVVFALARGMRLGPARPIPPAAHRSTLEYLHSFSWLVRRARVERELVRELYARLRALMHERAGVLVTLPDAEAARELELQCRIPAAEYLGLVDEVRALESSARVSPSQYAAVARRFARLERVLTGREGDRAR